MFDKELSEKFLKHIEGMSLKELEERANNAPDSGIGPILDSAIGLSFASQIAEIDTVDYLTKEEAMTLVENIKNSKPLEPVFQKILDDNLLDLF